MSVQPRDRRRTVSRRSTRITLVPVVMSGPGLARSVRMTMFMAVRRQMNVRPSGMVVGPVDSCPSMRVRQWLPQHEHGDQKDSGQTFHAILKIGVG